MHHIRLALLIDGFKYSPPQAWRLKTKPKPNKNPKSFVASIFKCWEAVLNPKCAIRFWEIDRRMIWLPSEMSAWHGFVLSFQGSEKNRAWIVWTIYRPQIWRRTIVPDRSLLHAEEKTEQWLLPLWVFHRDRWVLLRTSFSTVIHYFLTSLLK